MLTRFTLIGSIAFFLSCSKNDVVNIDDGLVEALVLDSGPLSVDGCEWVIAVDSGWYSPVNLEERFKIDELSVRIQHEFINDIFLCGWTGKLDKINILEIRKN